MTLGDNPRPPVDSIREINNAQESISNIFSEKFTPYWRKQCNHPHILNISQKISIKHTFYKAFAKNMNEINLWTKLILFLLINRYLYPNSSVTQFSTVINVFQVSIKQLIYQRRLGLAHQYYHRCHHIWI